MDADDADDAPDLLEAAFAASPIGMALLAPDGRWLRVNAALCSMLDYAEPELLDGTFQDVTHPDDLEADEALVARTLAGELPGYTLDKRYRRRDGSIVWAQLTVSLVREPDGSPRMFISQVVDLTERREAEHYSAAITSSMREGLLLTADGVIRDVNPAMCEMTGYAKDELIGASVPYPFWAPEADEAIGHHRQTVTDEGGAVSEALYRHRNGRRFHVSINTVAARGADGSAPGYISTVRDITDERLQRAELERSNQELQEFVYIASHDLSAPLRVVSGFVALLERHFGEGLDEEAARYMAAAVGGTERMQGLIDDLVKYSRLGGKEVRRAPVALGDLVGAALASLAEPLRASGAVVTVAEDLPTLQGDAGQLTQVMTNLVSNALKYADGPPRIEIDAAWLEGDWTVSVRDHGIGIPAADRDRVFKMFQRLHARDEYSGTGVGLAICRRVIDRHGGRLWIEDTPGGGTTFFFTLPDSA